MGSCRGCKQLYETPLPCGLASDLSFLPRARMRVYLSDPCPDFRSVGGASRADLDTGHPVWLSPVACAHSASLWKCPPFSGRWASLPSIGLFSSQTWSFSTRHGPDLPLACAGLAAVLGAWSALDGPHSLLWLFEHQSQRCSEFC